MRQLRIAVIMALFVLGFLGLIGRLYYLQVIKGPDLRAASRPARIGAQLLPPVRGLIVDRNGRVLASNETLYTVNIDSTLTEDLEGSVRALASAAGLAPDDIEAAMAAFENDAIKSRVMKRGLSAAEADRIRNLRIPGVHFTEQYHRVYPEATLASHLIGYTGAGARGLAGIEYALDDKLKGSWQKITMYKDIRRKLLSERDYTKETSNHGVDAVLTIDSYIQFVVERELKKVCRELDALYANCVVMHPKTGEVLALANYPTFDPNHWRDYPEGLRQNKLLTGVYEPGSVMKPFSIIAALDQKVVAPDMMFDCENGSWYIYGKAIRDDIHSFGSLSVHDILVRSSNIGTVKVIRRMGESPDDFRGQAHILHDYFRRFGFKHHSDPNTTSIRGESGGILWPPQQWRPASIRAVPFGQGMATNTLILTAAYAAIANRGLYVEPRLVLGYRTAAGEFYPQEPEPPRRAVDAAVVEDVVDMLVDVTEDPEGTGRRIRIPGFLVAGKTGTAQKVDPRTKTYGRGMRIASFAGFFPAGDPQVCIVVMVDEPKKKKYGGEVAGPVWKTIAEEIIAYWGMTPNSLDAPPPAEDRGGGSGNPEGAEDGLRVDTRLPYIPSGERGAEPGAMPDLAGLPVREAYAVLARNGLTAEIRGSGKVVWQETPPGNPVGEGANVGAVTCGAALADPSLAREAEVLAKR